MQDYALRQDVLDQLEFEPSIDANDIGVTVEDGVVTLTGHVPSYRQKLATERLVSRIKGVRGLAVEIEVRSGTMGTADDQIAKRALNFLKWSTMVPADKVQVKVENGWVTLTGTLDWQYQKDGAAAALRDLKGVKGITNLIELRPRVSSKDVKARIEGALKRSADLEAHAITVNVLGNKVVLDGNVRAWSERHLVENAAWSVPGVMVVEDRLTVS
jgi:osmotically-inducible protein OsmY